MKFFVEGRHPSVDKCRIWLLGLILKAARLLTILYAAFKNLIHFFLFFFFSLICFDNKYYVGQAKKLTKNFFLDIKKSRQTIGIPTKKNFKIFFLDRQNLFLDRQF